MVGGPVWGLDPGSCVMTIWFFFFFFQETKQELMEAWVKPGEKCSRSSSWQDWDKAWRRWGKLKVGLLSRVAVCRDTGGRVEETSRTVGCGCRGGNYPRCADIQKRGYILEPPAEKSFQQTVMPLMSLLCPERDTFYLHNLGQFFDFSLPWFYHLKIGMRNHKVVVNRCGGLSTVCSQ